MKTIAIFLIAGFTGSVFALPPVTKEEAIAFHEKGLCQMAKPGAGITRYDGDGWIASPYPGGHKLYALGGRVRVHSTGMSLVDLTPGKPVEITVTPSNAAIYWCPKYSLPGRDECGPVPLEFLYNSVKVGDK